MQASSPESPRVYDILYEKRRKERKDRSPLDIDYEKNHGECTFKPKLYYFPGSLKKP